MHHTVLYTSYHSIAIKHDVFLPQFRQHSLTTTVPRLRKISLAPLLQRYLNHSMSPHCHQQNLGEHSEPAALEMKYPIGELFDNHRPGCLMFLIFRMILDLLKGNVIHFGLIGPYKSQTTNQTIGAIGVTDDWMLRSQSAVYLKVSIRQ